MNQLPRAAYTTIPDKCPFCSEPHSNNELCIWKGDKLVISRNKYPYNDEHDHLLIYPKRHIIGAINLSPEEYSEFPKVHAVLDEILGREHTIILRNGIGSLPHLHYHVFPVNMYSHQIEEIMRDPKSQPHNRNPNKQS